MPVLGLKLRLNRISARILSVFTNNLQMWHKFTANPWTGSNRLPDSSPVGTNTGALFTGRALDFDGVNDWVDCGNPNITCRSLVLYINPDVTTDEIMRLTSAINVSIVSGTLTATGWTSPTLYVNGVAGTSVSASAWHQIAITSATGFTVNDLELGRTSATAWYSGLMANVKIFSVELSAAQVAELYANPEQALPTGVTAGQLVGWWPLTEAGNTIIANAASGSTYGILSGGAPVLANGGMLPQFNIKSISTPMVFDNVDDYIDCGAVINLSNDFTFSSWFNTNDGTLEFFWGSSASLGIRIVTNDLRLDIVGVSNILTYSILSNFNKICYLVVTRSGNNFTMYFNGVSVSTGTNTATPGTQTIFLGRRQDTNTGYFSGYIFNAAFFDAALTASAVSALYSAGIKHDLRNTTGNYTATSNLKAYWINTGNTNNDWLDLSGNGKNGTVNGSPVQNLIPESTTVGVDILGMSIARQNKGAFIDDGVSYAQIADAASLDITSAITLEAWVRPFTVSTAQTIIGKNNAYALNITSGAKLQFQRWSSTTSGTVASNASLVANTWRHVAITYNGTTTLIYINGVLDTTSTAISGAIDATSTAVLLGALTTTTQQFSGYIDNARIYSAVLTAAQIAGNYKAEKGGYN